MLSVRIDQVAEGTKSRSYPWIGVAESTGTVVLFVSPHRGMFLGTTTGKNSEFYCPGHFQDNWAEIDFSEYCGSITLSNK